jgi:hypothetical protein
VTPPVPVATGDVTALDAPAGDDGDGDGAAGGDADTDLSATAAPAGVGAAAPGDVGPEDDGAAATRTGGPPSPLEPVTTCACA